ncbi:putative hypothetical protein associated with flagellum synthesis [Octadecabacter antarcticus 307]|jgi:hypothetical protein|uniref:Uncharacterized protein n=1 Tax=Octadecabacter antarcticus 307 TaxID=391626 RepID=M9R8G2_9RHOB|nr:hypothetical protein [Octadecabacter antarcticus]AGI68502.1 putative hypothetical protein associated with flagellum synthesis [Octadecabacter antarcticus 307]
MTSASPDISTIIIVVTFLALLIAARQVIVSKAGIIRKQIEPSASRIKLRETQQIDRTTQLSLYELDGQRVVIVHGPNKMLAMLALPPSENANE